MREPELVLPQSAAVHNRKRRFTLGQSYSKIARRLTYLVITVSILALISTIGATNSTTTFRACFGVLLSLLACFQLYVAVVLFINRANTLIELAQPMGLAIFSLAGSIATACAFSLALPEYNLACNIRQPIILTCISLMGSILVARSWRISCIICPTLGFAADRENNFIHSARSKLMDVLTKLSAWSLIVGRCGRGARIGTQNALRMQVTFADLLRVTAILMVPQIILQIVNLCLPGLRMHSTEIDEGIYACESGDVGAWFLALGVVIASLPFFLALLLNIQNVGMPDLFREYDQLATCMRASVGVLLTTLPTIAMIDQTISNAHAYLVAGSLMSFLLPLHYYIAFLRLLSVKKKATRKLVRSDSAPITASTPTPTTARGMGRMESNLSRSRSHISSSGDDPETLRMAENSTIYARMFQSMGRHGKAIEVRKGICKLLWELCVSPPANLVYLTLLP